MGSYDIMIETAELASRLREWEQREQRDADDRWRTLVVDDEIGDDDGPETWAGLLA